jgi:hypothetical protein
MPRIDDPPGAVPGIRAVDVDVSGLDMFAGSVEDELQSNFQPQATTLMMVYQVGSYFGIGHASSDVQGARERYTVCLQAAINQLAGYANATQILVDAARTVAARYRDTDALAAANSDEVRRVLAQAVIAAGKAVADGSSSATEVPQ